MGWCRITILPSDYSNPKLLRELQQMNAEADRLDPLTRPDHSADLREAEDDWSDSDGNI